LAESSNKLANYFSLWGPYPVMGGTGSEKRKQVYLFAGVALGAASKVIYDVITQSTAFAIGPLAVALIASVVIFPQLYYTGGLDRRKLSFAHWALAFQNGFFWSVAFDQLVKKVGGS